MSLVGGFVVQVCASAELINGQLIAPVVWCVICHFTGVEAGILSVSWCDYRVTTPQSLTR